MYFRILRCHHIMWYVIIIYRIGLKYFRTLALSTRPQRWIFNFNIRIHEKCTPTFSSILLFNVNSMKYKFTKKKAKTANQIRNSTDFNVLLMEKKMNFKFRFWNIHFAAFVHVFFTESLWFLLLPTSQQFFTDSLFLPPYILVYSTLNSSVIVYGMTYWYYWT